MCWAKNPHFMSMVALQYTTSIIVLCDGSTEAAPWTPFHVTYGKVTTVQDTAE